MNPLLLALAALAVPLAAHAAPKILSRDYHVDAVDPGIKLFVREKMAEGAKATEDNVVLFVHGATFPSTPDFDLQFKDYSWADWMVNHEYVVYLFDKRNYGFSTREKAMDEPPAANKPVSRSYLVVRDIGAVVDHIRAKNKVARVTLIGWSWGAMTAGYYTSLWPEKVRKLVLYAPLYENPLHTNLGAGTGLQNKRVPWEFNSSNGAYRLGTAEANQKRWDGEIPVQDKTQYRDQDVLEDSFYQATGRRMWNAANITVPTLVIAGEDDTWSFPQDREGLLRDLTNAPGKKHVTLPRATHFVLFEKQRFRFFEEIASFLKGGQTATR